MVNTIVTLITDFGEFYQGIIKGIILNHIKDATIIDISHSVESQNVYQGAFLLYNSYKFFPKGTIHFAIVDPEVGSKRDAIIVETNNYFFVGPDNGILYPSCAEDGIIKIWKIKEKVIGKKVSYTFHGRDVFAPSVKFIVNRNLSSICEEKKDMKKINIFDCKLNGNLIKCRIIYIDKFGNLITNVRKNDILKTGVRYIKFKNIKIPFVKTYSDVNVGDPLALIGSFNTLEISIREGSAKDFFKAVCSEIELLLEV